MYALTEYPAIVFILNKWICVSIEKDAAVEIARSGILPTLAQALRCKSSLSCQVALVVAEMAREGRILLMLFEKTKSDKLYNISPTNDKMRPYCCLLLSMLTKGQLDDWARASSLMTWSLSTDGVCNGITNVQISTFLRTLRTTYLCLYTMTFLW